MIRLLILLLLVFDGTGLWATETEPAANPGLIQVGMQTGALMPYYSDEGPQYRGILKDLLDAFAESAGLRVAVQVLPTKRMIQNMVSGVLDMQLPDHPLWSAEEKAGARLIYSHDVVGLSVSGVFALRTESSVLQPDSIHTVGVPRGFTATSVLGLIKTGRLQISELPDSRTVLQSLLARRVDSVYGDFRVMSDLLRELNSKASLALVEAFPSNRNFHYRASFSERNGALCDAFNKFLESPSARAIYGRYQLSP